MRRNHNPDSHAISRSRTAVALLAVISLLAGYGWPVAAQQAPAKAVVVGRLYGEDIDVKNAVSVDPSYGLSTALLASGTEVTVRSGRAQVELMHGGSIAICGPAHFTLLESGGAITLALDYGKVRPQLEAQTTLTVYTPMVVATPIAIGTSPRDFTVGLDQQGAMCALPTHGGARIEQQLTGQSLLVPQGGEVSMNGGQLGTIQNAPGTCDCELLVTRNTAPGSLELSRPVPNPATRPQPANVAPPRPAEQPIYRVYLPPLTYDANAPDPDPDPDPAHILMIREAPPLADPRPNAPLEPTLETASNYLYLPPAAAQPRLQTISLQSAPPRPVTVQSKHPGVFVRILHVMFG
jgi:hypothetical protein